MLRALAADFCAIDGVQVDVMRDRRLGAADLPEGVVHEVGSARQERDTLSALAGAADWSVIIAPEFDGHLLDRCQWVEGAGGRLLGPGSPTVALASNKQKTAEHLAARGVRVPEGVTLEPGDPLPPGFGYPAVLKPRDGAGSRGIRWIDEPRGGRVEDGVPMRLEQFSAGTAASVACLGGPRGVVLLRPCQQRLSDDGRFEYLGGRLPLDANSAARAARLAARAIDTLDRPLGYLGVDLVLGPDPRGADDVVIEINPRLTTSYVGLRALARENLAAAMLGSASGRQVELSWRHDPIQFDSAGRVRREGVSTTAAKHAAARPH